MAEENMAEEIIEINSSVIPLAIFICIALALVFGYFVAKSSSAKKNELDKVFNNKLFVYIFYPFLFLSAVLIGMSDINLGMKWIFGFGLVFTFCFSLGYCIERGRNNF